jgi:EAL and modified HD-GYP domain-containing signal transduction protein
MSAQTLPARPQNGSLQDLVRNSLQGPGGEVCYVARQPILDHRSKVHGYELLCWNGRQRAAGADKELAARTLLGNAVVFGVAELTSGLPAFVPCTADSLTEEWLLGLPPELTVVELDEEVEPTESVLAAWRALKQRGFRLAVDNFAGRPEAAALVAMADFVKVDIAKAGANERLRLLSRLAHLTAQPIARNVETPEDWKHVREEGFELFEGYYFCRPEPVKNARMPANRLVHLEILEVLQRDPVDLNRLTQLVMCDASLTYALLRLVNSPVCALRQQVSSIHTALILLGEATARRLAMLAIASDFNGEQPQELLRMAFERGRFCELSAGLMGLVPSEQYLIGMVSMFPAMLRISIQDLVKTLPLREEARNALLGMGNREGVLLDLVLCQERRDWERYDAILAANSLRFDHLMWRLSEAITWAKNALDSAV